MCARVQDGAKCATRNANRLRNCARCGKPRQRRETSKTRHMAVLRDLPYEWWIQRFGAVCGVCGRPASPTRRLDRDHDHATGEPRGVLCHLHNRMLGNTINLATAQAIVAYLERFERSRGQDATNRDHGSGQSRETRNG